MGIYGSRETLTLSGRQTHDMKFVVTTAEEEGVEEKNM